MNKKLYIESGWLSLNKMGEELCGDRVECINLDDSFLMVLADGLGSGVKANILSTLTSKIISTMLASGLPIEECVDTIAQTLPVCSQRKVAYSTFTILQAFKYTGQVNITQFDNPSVIILRDGKSICYDAEKRVIAGKNIYETRFDGKIGDLFIMMSDGAIHAGVGTVLNFGWQEPEIIEYAQCKYTPDMSAKSMAATICDACRDLYMDMPGDDTTVAALRLRRRQHVGLMIGPPVNPADDHDIISRFFAEEGKHIVCGGTTSTIVSRFLDKPIRTSLDYYDPKIPPTGSIEGVDLVTEGVVTLSRVVELAEKYISTQDTDSGWRSGKDGASQIACMLFEEATDISFYVGRAINPAHQNPNLPIGLSIKMRLIKDLSKLLEQMGKRVEMTYY
ncbi:MAG: SpoIIE family protein phosphatase [Angelakisella sp.]|nr:SpoIIE family protein phosphatase [Angelakisella sp.]